MVNRPHIDPEVGLLGAKMWCRADRQGFETQDRRFRLSPRGRLRHPRIPSPGSAQGRYRIDATSGEAMGRDRGQPAHGRRKDAGPFLHGWSRAKLDERRCLDVEFVFVFGRDGEAFRDGADGGTAIEPDRDYEIVGEASQLQQIGDEDRKVGDARRAAEGASVKYPDEPGDDGPPVDAEMAAGGRVFGLTRSEKDRSDVDSGENGGASSFIDGERVGSIASAGIGIMRHGHEVGALGRRNEWRSPKARRTGKPRRAAKQTSFWMSRPA